MITSKKATLFLCFFMVCNNTYTREIKPWTVMIFIEARNDLAPFAPLNLYQMEAIGSNDQVNIVVKIITSEKDDFSCIKTFYIEKNSQALLKEKSVEHCNQSEELISFCCETIQEFPAQHYALIFWNHGTGAIDPLSRSHLSLNDLFSLSSYTDLSHERTPHFPALPNINTPSCFVFKGVCFEDHSGQFFTEQQLCNALKIITDKALQGKKIDLIGFDACHMAMLEIATAVQPFATIMVGSQDVEPGTGWNYKYVFALFTKPDITAKKFGAHIVQAYKKYYNLTTDYTQSCIDLEEIPRTITLFSQITHGLQQLATLRDSKRIHTAVKLSKNKHLCTHFDEPFFIDIDHFLTNLINNISTLRKFKDGSSEALIQKLLSDSKQLQEQFKKAVYLNCTGKDYPKAAGLSIYFPEHSIHSSYKKSIFAHETRWPLYLKTYLSHNKK